MLGHWSEAGTIGHKHGDCLDSISKLFRKGCLDPASLVAFLALFPFLQLPGVAAPTTLLSTHQMPGGATSHPAREKGS